MIKRGKYRFVLSALTVSFLSSTVLWAKSDQELTAELEQEYRAFASGLILNNSTISPAVQFVQHFFATKVNDEDFAKKSGLLLGYGLGVGGISSQRATEEERQILFTGIAKAKNKGATIDDFVSPASTAALVKSHQQYVATVFNTPGSVDDDSYKVFNRKVMARYAVNNQNYRELERDIGKDISNQLRTIGSDGKISHDRQVQLIESLLTVQDNARTDFLPLAQELFEYQNDQYQQEALNYLTKLKTNDERRQFVNTIEDQKLWNEDEEKMHLGMQAAAAAAELIKPGMSRDLQKKIIKILGNIDLEDFPTFTAELKAVLDKLKDDCENYDEDGDLRNVLSSLLEVAAEKRQQVLAKAATLIKPGMGGLCFGKIIVILDNIDLEELPTFTVKLEAILGKFRIDHSGGWGAILKTLKGAKSDNQRRWVLWVLAKAATLIKPDMRLYICNQIMELLDDTPDVKKLKLFTKTLKTILDQFEDASYFHDDILTSLCNVKAEKRQQVLAKAATLIKPGMNGVLFNIIVNMLEEGVSVKRCETIVDSIMTWLQSSNLDISSRQRILEMMNNIPGQYFEGFFKRLSRIMVNFDNNQRRSVFAAIIRVGQDDRLEFVEFIDYKNVTNVVHINELADGYADGYYDSRYWTSTLNSLIARERLIEQIYTNLDEQSLHIDREKLKQWKLPEIKMTAYTTELMNNAFNTIVDKLNLDDSKKSDYLSASLFEGTNNDSKNNREKIEEVVLPKIHNFLDNLWDIKYSHVFVMHDDYKPVFRKAVSYVLDYMMNVSDSDTRRSMFVQFANGVVHCPTGQKAAVDTLIYSITSQDLTNAETLKHKLEQLLAAEKNRILNSIVTYGTHTQNVHVIDYYQYRLKDILGLSSSIEDYRDRSSDDFNITDGNLVVVLKGFYKKFTPEHVIKTFYNAVQTKADAELQISAITAAKADKPRIKEQLKQVKIARPFTPTDVLDDLIQNGKVQRNTNSEDDHILNGWENYFSDDPLSGGPFELTEAGAKQYLIDAGILLQKAE